MQIVLLPVKQSSVNDERRFPPQFYDYIEQPSEDREDKSSAKLWVLRRAQIQVPCGFAVPELRLLGQGESAITKE